MNKLSNISISLEAIGADRKELGARTSADRDLANQFVSYRLRGWQAHTDLHLYLLLHLHMAVSFTRTGAVAS